MEQYKAANYPTLNGQQGKKTKRPATLFHALQKLAHVNRENDYLVAKWYNRDMEEIRFLTLRDYFGSLEQIIKEIRKQEKKAK